MISEDEVTQAVVEHLKQRGFHSDWLNAGQQGFDIDAKNADGTRWLIECKGAANSKVAPSPERKEYGSGQTFSLVGQAFLTAISWLDRADCTGANVGIAIPKTKWFDEHSRKIERVCRNEGITIFRVDPVTLLVTEI